MKTNWLLISGLGLLLNFHLGVAGPLDNWHWRNPLPSGNPQAPQAGPHTLNGIAFAAGKFVAVGASGVVSISTDTTNWIESPTATTNNLNGMIYANGQFVAVGDGGVVETSIDGSNWTLQNSGTTNPLSAVAYGNGRYVAVGGYANETFVASDGKAVISSPNGVSWTPVVSGLSGAVKIAGGNDGFVALIPYVYNGPSAAQAFFSTDGLNWTSQTLSGPGSGTVFLMHSLVNNIVTYWNGVFLIGSYQYATTMSANVYFFSSPDGTNWSTNTVGNEFTGTGGFGYGFFMSTGTSIIASGIANYVPFLQFSSDAITWPQTDDIPSSYGQYGLGPIAGAFGNGTYVILGRTDINNSLPPIFTSTDGLTWTNRQHAPPSPPAATGPTYTFISIATNNGVDVVVSGTLVAISSNGLSYVTASNTPVLSSVITFSNKFVGVGPGGALYVSGDGLSWTQRTSGTASGLHGVVAGNGLLVAVGDSGAIQTSPTSTIWTSRTSGTSLPLYGVAYSNGVFVAVGQLGTVLTSVDGINWAGQDSGQLANLLSVTYGSAGFLAAGLGGTVVTSPDGTNWVTQNSGVVTAFESVSFGNGYYLATGSNAVVMTSPDGVNWTPRNLGATGGQTLYGSAFINNRFEVVGSGGTVIESDPIAPLFDLQLSHGAQNKFTLFAPPGSNFRLQASTVLSASGWSDIGTFNSAPAITRWTNNSSGNQQYFRLVSP